MKMLGLEKTERAKNEMDSPSLSDSDSDCVCV